MDSVTLLAEASAAGLTVAVAGDKLHITGPDTPQAAGLVVKLAEHKPVVIGFIQATQAARALVGPLLGEPGWEDGDMAAVVGAVVAGDVYEVLQANLPEGWAYRATQTPTGWHVHEMRVSA